MFLSLNKAVISGGGDIVVTPTIAKPRASSVTTGKRNTTRFVNDSINESDDEDEEEGSDNRMTPAKRRKLMSLPAVPKDREWIPIGWLKVQETTKLALLAEYSCNLPSGCDENSIKITLAGTTLMIEVYMPELMSRGDVLYKSFKQTDEAEYHNRFKAHQKIMEEDLGMTDIDPDVAWPATIHLPHPALNNKILRKEITKGGSTGTTVLSLDMLLENPREKAVGFENNTIDDL